MSYYTLYKAIQEDDLQTLRIIIQRCPVAIHGGRDEGYDSLITFATKYASFTTFQWLIEQGANWQDKDPLGFTVFELAIFEHTNSTNDQRLKIDYLLEMGASFAHPIFALIYKGNQEAILAKHILEPESCQVQDRHKHNLLHYAAALGQVDTLTWAKNQLRLPLSTVTWKRMTPFLYAACNGHLSVVKCLLQSKWAFVQEKDIFGYTALLHAAQWGYLPIIQYLGLFDKTCYRQSDKDGGSALMKAADKGHLAIVKWLIQVGKVPVNKKCTSDWTALRLAAHSGHVEIVKWLIQMGGAHDKKTSSHASSAFLTAAGGGHLAVMQYLLNAGIADINEKNSDGVNALQFASASGHLAATRWLLERGSVTNIKDGVKHASGEVKLWLAEQKNLAKNIADKLKQGDPIAYVRFGYLNKGAAIMLCDAVQNAQCPTNVTFDFQSALGDKEVFALILQTLASGHCPERLSLNFANNNLGLQGAIQLTQVLLSGKCPAHLQIDFSHNNIGTKGYQLLMNVLENKASPAGLMLNISTDNIQEGRYRCVVIQQGTRQLTSLINQLPQEIWEYIYSYLNAYLENDNRKDKFPKRISQIVDKADKDSLILRLKYFVNFLEPNAYYTLAQGKTISDRSYHWLKNSAYSLSNLFQKPEESSKQLIKAIKVLINSAEKIVDVQLELNKIILKYLTKFDANETNKNKEILEQLIKYRLVGEDLIKNIPESTTKPTLNLL